MIQVPSEIVPMDSIGDRIRTARTELGLSQVELARRSGVSPGTIGNLEANTRRQPRNLLSIAKALHVRPEWLETGRGHRALQPETSHPLVAMEPRRAYAFELGATVAHMGALLASTPIAFRAALGALLQQWALAGGDPRFNSAVLSLISQVEPPAEGTQSQP